MSLGRCVRLLAACACGVLHQVESTLNDEVVVVQQRLALHGPDDGVREEESLPDNEVSEEEVREEEYLPARVLIDALNKTFAKPHDGKRLENEAGAASNASSNASSNSSLQIKELTTSWHVVGTENGTLIRMVGTDCADGQCVIKPADTNSRVYIDIKLGQELDSATTVVSQMRVKMLFIDKTFTTKCPVCGGVCVSKIMGYESKNTLAPCPIKGVWRLDLPLNHLQSLGQYDVSGSVLFHSAVIRKGGKKAAEYETMTTF